MIFALSINAVVTIKWCLKKWAGCLILKFNYSEIMMVVLQQVLQTRRIIVCIMCEEEKNMWGNARTAFKANDGNEISL